MLLSSENFRARSKLINIKQRIKKKKEKTKPSCCAKISVISDCSPRAASYNLLCPQTEPKTQIRTNTHIVTFSDTDFLHKS